MAVTLTKEFYINFGLFLFACVALALSIWAFATPCKKDGFGDTMTNSDTNYCGWWCGSNCVLKPGQKCHCGAGKGATIVNYPGPVGECKGYLFNEGSSDTNIRCENGKDITRSSEGLYELLGCS